MPCHLTIDYEDRRWLKMWEAGRIGSICAGSLILMANVGKLPRDPRFPKRPPNQKLVFSSYQEFIDHHRNGLSQSWEDP